MKGGEAESHPPSSTGISGTFTAAAPDVAGPAPVSAADTRCRAAQDLQNVAAQPFRVVLRHGTAQVNELPSPLYAPANNIPA